jgi:hypothetical protein
VEGSCLLCLLNLCLSLVMYNYVFVLAKKVKLVFFMYTYIKKTVETLGFGLKYTYIHKFLS